MSFWRTFGFTVSAVETILERENFTLEELLDEEEVLQECKAQNKKLLDFLTDPEILVKLFNYITEDADEEADSKRRFKYPYISCEILCCEVWQICDAIYQDEKLLDLLYAFLDKAPPLNALLMTYICRVAGVLLQRKISETIAYMKSKENIIAKFIKHLANSSVMDLLLKIIACEDTVEGSGVLEWLCQTNLIPCLVEKFDPKFDAEVHENASQALLDIISVSMNAVPPLMTQLESQDTITKIVDFVLLERKEGKSTSVLLHGLTVINELLKRHVNDHYDANTKIESLVPILQVLVRNLDKFLDILVNPKAEALLTASGNLEPPFGFPRLKVLELFLSILRTKYRSIDEILVKLDVFTVCLDLFFSYPLNNFLHHVVQQKIIIVLEGYNDDLIVSLFERGNLLSRIVQADQMNRAELAKPGWKRRSYMGFITVIAQQIETAISGIPKLEQIAEASDVWKKYVQGSLAEIKNIEGKPLGPHKPVDFPADSSEEEDEQDRDSILSKYRLGFTDNFADDLEDDDENDLDDEEN